MKLTLKIISNILIILAIPFLAIGAGLEWLSDYTHDKSLDYKN